MERCKMFLERKNQYCQNDHITQGNLSIQFNPYQITNAFLIFFADLELKNLKFVWKHKRPE